MTSLELGVTLNSQQKHVGWRVFAAECMKRRHEQDILLDFNSLVRHVFNVGERDRITERS